MQLFDPFLMTPSCGGGVLQFMEPVIPLPGASTDDGLDYLLAYDLNELLAEDDMLGSFLAPYDNGALNITAPAPVVQDTSSSLPSAETPDSAAGSVQTPLDGLIAAATPQDHVSACVTAQLRPPSGRQVVRRTCTSGPKAKAALVERGAAIKPAVSGVADAAVGDFSERQVTTSSPPSITAAEVAAALLEGNASGSYPASAPSHEVAEQDSEDSADESDAVTATGKTGGAGNKRKAPDVDWRAITDPAERRRQRRLAKNRVTAARSRERKKVQWADMEQRFITIQAENARLRKLLEQLAAENGSLKSQLQFAAVAATAATVGSTGGVSHQTGNSTEPAADVLFPVW